LFSKNYISRTVRGEFELKTDQNKKAPL
jgi:hypothetical protein